MKLLFLSVPLPLPRRCKYTDRPTASFRWRSKPRSNSKPSKRGVNVLWKGLRNRAKVLESALDDANSRGSDIEESCEASDVEKTRLQLQLITSCPELITSHTVLLMILLFVCFDMIALPCGTDLHLPDMPLVYASDAFFKLTGNMYNVSYLPGSL